MRNLMILFVVLIALTGCGAEETPTPTPEATAQPVTAQPATAQPVTAQPVTARPVATTTPADPGVLAVDQNRAEMLARVPELADREARFQAALASDQPILLLSETDEMQQKAQEIAIASADFQRFAYDPVADKPLRSEIMIVRPTLPSDLSEKTAICQQTECYRVEMYNYATNATAVALVDLQNALVLDTKFLANTQPEVPAKLGELAAKIAISAPEVAEALGFVPGIDQAGMPTVKTALNGSLCERSHHLCVAPTFIVGDRALWAIVDLTDEQLVGIRWTELGVGRGQPVTEQSLQDSVIMAKYCEKTNPLTRDGWQLDFMLTSSDGLQVSNVRHQGNPVINSAKLVDWHVSYSVADGFGYNDATGCPMFSTASVVAFDAPYQEEIVENGEVVGFALSQDFRSDLWPLPCNYRYEQRYEFYNDGRFRAGGANLGQGCGNTGTYRPVSTLANL